MTDALKQRIEDIAERMVREQPEYDHVDQQFCSEYLTELATELTSDNAALRAQLDNLQRDWTIAKKTADNLIMEYCKAAASLRAQLAEKEAALALEVSNHNSTVDRSAELLAELAEKERELAESKRNRYIDIDAAILCGKALGLTDDDDRTLVQAAKDLRAQLNAALAKNQWQPISTAPKDGTRIRVANRHGVWDAEYHKVFQSGYAPENPWMCMMLNCQHMERFTSTIPTHWQTLPQPPEEK